MIHYTGVINETDTNSGSEDTTNPYFINCCGYIKIMGKSVAINRRRVDYYLIYLVDGKGYYRTDNGFMTVPGGNIVIYRPGEEQNYFYSGDDNTELYWIHFTGTEVKRLLDTLSLADRRVYEVGIQTECIQLFDKIIHEIHIKNPRYHSFCIGYLLQLLSIFSREYLLHEKGNKILKNRDIENVINKMQLEYQQNHPIKYYADYCNLSVYQFIRKFKKSTHMSPSEYIEKIRIDRSRELLADTDLAVNEISDIVGYNDPFYFSKVFKKNTGLNPMAFRKRKKGISPEIS